MEQVSIIFEPFRKSVIVPKNTTILEAAREAKIYINSICGGEGVCGKCKVILKKGDIKSSHSAALAFLTVEELKQGYVLACQSKLVSDAVVEVPQEAIMRLKQVVDEDAKRFRETEQKLFPEYPHNPLCQKLFLCMSPPSLKDNTSDLERIFREIRRVTNFPIMQTGLYNLQRVSNLLRESNWQITATVAYRGGTVEVVEFEKGDTTKENYGVAIDVGTTTIVAHLIDLNSGKTLATNAMYNSQISYGEDILTRIIFATEHHDGLSILKNLIVDDINSLITSLCVETGLKLNNVKFIQIAGNPTMVHILLGIEPKYIRLEPYVTSVNFPPVIRACEVGIRINPRGLLGCTPSVSSYVGGDVVAGILYSGMHKSDTLSLYIDLGTNGEIVFGNKDWLVCCAASAGPTFEGGGIKCGMRAERGAIEKITINNKIECITIGNYTPIGICGSGLIDIIAEFFKIGLIDRTGKFVDNSVFAERIREIDGLKEFVLNENTDVVLTETDIASFLRSKGAIYTGAKTLVNSFNFNFKDINQVYISGGFGNYLDISKAIRVGLLPDLPLNRFQFIGNGAVQGAKCILLSTDALKEAEKIAEKMTYFELSTNIDFMNNFSASLFLPHTDLAEFPCYSSLSL